MPLALSAYLSVATVLTLMLLGAGLWWDRSIVAEHRWILAAWICAIAIVGLAAVPSEGETQLSLDMPLAIAACLIYGPWVGGAAAFIGYCDLREIRREIPILRGVFNRAQVALSVISAGVIFAALSPQGIQWPASLFAAGAAVAGDTVVNYLLVGTAKSLHERRSPVQTLLTLRFGSVGSFALTYLSYGLMSIVLAEVFRGAGVWGLAAFAMPVFLARVAFDRERILELAGARIRTQSQLIRRIAVRTADERRDERMMIAADLHDEVLPPLFQVHLVAQVVRQDLANGRLLALEEDVPALVDAVTRASEVVRRLVRGLRQSPLGTTGFEGTLRLLVEQLKSATDAEFVLELEEIKGPPVLQLLAYQVVREALANAVRHSGASRIRVCARVAGGAVRLLVEDDGFGFDPRTVDESSHFGLAMMRERVELIGGVLHLESGRGRGTRVLVRLPLDADVQARAD